MNEPAEPVIAALEGRRRRADLFAEERRLAAAGLLRVAGVDEAGRGPLAGPVVAAAVILPPYSPELAGRLAGVDDSKRLTPEKRASLFQRIGETAVAVGVASLEAEEIDRRNILRATLEAMARALAALDPQPQLALVDGLHTPPGWPGAARALVGGDGLSVSVAAASIVAKVTRDRIMEDWDDRYPHYGFRRHKGYCTEEHLRALERHGLTPLHRRTFCIGTLERWRQGLLFTS